MLFFKNYLGDAAASAAITAAAPDAAALKTPPLPPVTLKTVGDMA
jgi:hypothetical protein